MKKVSRYISSLILVILILSMVSCTSKDDQDSAESSTDSSAVLDNTVTFSSLTQNGFSIPVGDVNVVIKEFDTSIVSYSCVESEDENEKILNGCPRIDYNVDFHIRDLYLYFTAMTQDSFEDTLEDKGFKETKSFYEGYSIYTSKKKNGIYAIYDAGDVRVVSYMNLGSEKATEKSSQFQEATKRAIDNIRFTSDKSTPSIKDSVGSIAMCGLSFADDCTLAFWNEDLLRVTKNGSALYLPKNSDTLISFDFTYLGKVNDVMCSYCEVEEGVYGITLLNGATSYYLWYYCNQAPSIEDIDDYFIY